MTERPARPPTEDKRIELSEEQKSLDSFIVPSPVPSDAPKAPVTSLDSGDVMQASPAPPEDFDG